MVVRCECATVIAKTVEYARAGVPELYRTPEFAPSTRGAVAALRAIGPLPRRESRREIVFARMREASTARAELVAGVLRAYVDAGLHAARGRLAEMTDDWFVREEQQRWRDECRAARCFVLEADNPLANKMCATVAGEIVALRSGVAALTVVVSADEIADMPVRYGEQAASLFGSRHVRRIGIGAAK